MADTNKLKIVSTHIENDIRNNAPTLVFTDENGTEWVNEETNSQHGFITTLVKKENSWYFNGK